jgi:hypothetical protein
VFILPFKNRHVWMGKLLEERDSSKAHGTVCNRAKRMKALKGGSMKHKNCIKRLKGRQQAFKDAPGTKKPGSMKRG